MPQFKISQARPDEGTKEISADGDIPKTHTSISYAKSGGRYLKDRMVDGAVPATIFGQAKSWDSLLTYPALEQRLLHAKLDKQPDEGADGKPVNESSMQVIADRKALNDYNAVAHTADAKEKANVNNNLGMTAYQIEKILAAREFKGKPVSDSPVIGIVAPDNAENKKTVMLNSEKANTAYLRSLKQLLENDGYSFKNNDATVRTIQSLSPEMQAAVKQSLKDKDNYDLQYDAIPQPVKQAIKKQAIAKPQPKEESVLDKVGKFFGRFSY